MNFFFPVASKLVFNHTRTDMFNFKKTAVVGSTGMVGSELQNLLDEKAIKCFASTQKEGAETLCETSFEDLDFAFFCAGSAVSKKWIPVALNSGTRVVDLSSAYRTDPAIPLIIPEINGHLLEQKPQLVSSPNCTTSIMLMALNPLHKLFGVKQLTLSTYQAFSGAGRRDTEALLAQTGDYLNTGKPGPFAFNLFLHPGDEEEKMVFETRKILNLPQLPISATCVRVPTLRAHSISLYAEFLNPVDLELAERALQQTEGVIYAPATPQQASYQHNIFVHRVRKESSHALNLFIIGDQLLKGAALNAFQIAKKLSIFYTLGV